LNEPPHTPVRAVFDNNVLLQAMSNANGPAGACVQAVRELRISLCLSHDLIRKLADVASRPLLVRKLHLTEIGAARFIAEMEALSEVIYPVPEVFQHPLDPKDSMVVNLAVAAGAHVITSRDRHLLSLRDATIPAGAEFLARFGHIDVLTPIELLNRIRNK
jgi:putative PIN family toxin of toxin-antitoxin system